MAQLSDKVNKQLGEIQLKKRWDRDDNFGLVCPYCGKPPLNCRCGKEEEVNNERRGESNGKDSS